MNSQLVWAEAKAQLYLLEAAHVKSRLGREKIRRNKDALRELRCLQEILAELHAGDLGRGPKDVATINAALHCFSALNKEATIRGTTLDHVYQVPQRIKDFLRARQAVHKHAGLAPLTGSCSDAAVSTRAPSTAAGQDPDVLSVVTDSRSEQAGNVDVTSNRASGSQRLNNEQLDRLAKELREQLDQEYTSLVTSIDEVQALMEAEVVRTGHLPSDADLQQFIVDADAVLGHRRESAVEHNSAASIVDYFSGADAASPAHLPNDHAGHDQQDAESDDFNRTDSPQSGLHSLTPEALVRRPRWADFSDSDEQAPCGEGSADGATPMRSRGARAVCHQCGELRERAAFSRRAWRQVRRGGAMSSAAGTNSVLAAACFVCRETAAPQHSVSQSLRKHRR